MNNRAKLTLTNDDTCAAIAYWLCESCAKAIEEKHSKGGK